MASRARGLAKLFGPAGLLARDADGVVSLRSSSLDQSLDDLSVSSLSDVDLVVNPETLEIQTVSSGPGQDMSWLWTWTRSALPYARIPITNQAQTTVPLYKKGTYTINNYSKFDSDSWAVGGDSNDQPHSLFLKWIDGAGSDNLVPWVTYTTATDNISSINGGASTQVQRLLVSVPDSDAFSIPTPAQLTAPNITYNVSHSAGKYMFMGAAHGMNPNLGPMYRGGTYTFSVNASGHPLYLTTDNGTNFVSGQYNYEYTTGVTNSRSDTGSLTIVVDASTPDTLYYQCGNHSNMRGEISVKDLEVEVSNNGRPVLYLQHGQEGMKNPAEIRPVPELSDQMCIVFDAATQKFVPQDLATYVERTPSFKNKIQEVAGTATLVAADGTAIVASVEVVDDASYLPLSNNSVGDLVYAKNTQTIYVWDGTTWLENTAGVDEVGIAALIDSDYVSARQTVAAATPYSLALSQAGTLTVTTGTVRWYAPANLTMNSVVARLGTAADATVTVVANKNGAAALTTEITAAALSATNNTSFSMVAGDYLTLDVTTIGSTNTGADLNVQFLYNLS